MGVPLRAISARPRSVGLREGHEIRLASSWASHGFNLARFESERQGPRQNPRAISEEALKIGLSRWPTQEGIEPIERLSKLAGSDRAHHCGAGYSQLSNGRLPQARDPVGHHGRDRDCSHCHRRPCWAVTSDPSGWFSGWRRADPRLLCRLPACLTGKGCVARRRPRTFGVT
jgi:hypothetical protein